MGDYICLLHCLYCPDILLQIGGERLYKKARRGEEITVAPRSVTIYDFHLERNSDNRSYLISPDDDDGSSGFFFPFQFSQTTSKRVYTIVTSRSFVLQSFISLPLCLSVCLSVCLSLSLSVSLSLCLSPLDSHFLVS
jgi:hypothetical protein